MSVAMTFFLVILHISPLLPSVWPRFHTFIYFAAGCKALSVVSALASAKALVDILLDVAVRT